VIRNPSKISDVNKDIQTDGGFGDLGDFDLDKKKKYYKIVPNRFRDVAQSGSAPEWGSGGPGFKSPRPDHAIIETEKF
jgi:hypothetical protein